LTITFQSPAHGDVIMLDTHARYAIRLMGHSETVPGAIDAEGVPDALRHLREALAQMEAGAEEADEGGNPEDEDEEPSVPWRRRTWPLIQMLEAAAANDAHIRWE
jgi:hypothetical protein